MQSSAARSAASTESAIPRAIGSYDILGPLASGGMAEILLSRRSGPSGFERLVVVKRVKPEFVRDPDFVAMFLDEARIVSEIRHHNVIHVEDLGSEGDELFLVMEYLAGEAVSGLQKRCITRDSSLSFGLAAYVIAEACAGLHAAHELVGPNGDPRHLVHRDISPQNIFITYEGQVKVLDFGIAKATHRMAPETQVGTIKGKLEYMSPEQARGEDLDRRSDVFALGIVLYELATGHRLFKRFNPLQCITAITTDPIIPPSRVRTGFPPALEAIIMRALARSSADRYATAADMRRDLMRALKDDRENLQLPDDPSAELAMLMHRLFEDRIAEKTELVRRARAGDSMTAIPAVEVDVTIELPSIPSIASAETVLDVATPVSTQLGHGLSARERELSTGRRRRTRSQAFFWVVVVALTTASLGIFMGRARILAAFRPTPPSVATAASATPPPSASETATTPTPAVSDAPSHAQAGASSTPSPPTHARPAKPTPPRHAPTASTPAIAAVSAAPIATTPAPPPAPTASSPFRRFQ